MTFYHLNVASKNESKTYINNVDKPLLEYSRSFATQIKLFSPGHQLLNVYNLFEGQKNVELLFVTFGTGLK